MLERHRWQGLEPFVPIKGYLDSHDRRKLRAAGVELRPYPQLRMRIAGLRSRLQSGRARQYFGVLEQGDLPDRAGASRCPPRRRAGRSIRSVNLKTESLPVRRH